MTYIAISTTALSKSYAIGSRRSPAAALRSVLDRTTDPPGAGVRRRNLDRGNVIWALRDVTIEIPAGEALGIVGRNGVGKSTLLKVISRITAPTAGRAVVRGRVGSLLEVGTGFHPELTGRENVFLNGAILGMTRGEILRKFDRIVAFAGIEPFIDTPVKRYSSGMRVRLAFAVAAHLEPEILLVDEVLAVGDAAFQKKCLGTLDEAATGGRTVLFVSHNMAAIQRLCNRVIWIDRGSIVADGEPGAVIEGYLASVHDACESAPAIKSPDGSLEIERVVLTRVDGGETTVFSPGESIAVDLWYMAHRAIDGAYFWIGVSGRHGHLFGANMLLDGARLGRLEGRGTLRCVFLRPQLMPQQAYYIRLGARQADGRTVLLPPQEAGTFRVAGSAGAIGLNGDHADWLVGDSTSLLLPYRWELPDGTRVSVGSKVGRLDDE